MSARGFVAGSLALIVLETLVQKGVSDKAGGLLTKSAEIFHAVLSPATPGLHWFAGGGSSSGSDTPGAASTTPSTPSAVVVRAGPQNPTIDGAINGTGTVWNT